MFTGIIEEIGRVSDISQKAEAFVLTIEAHNMLEDIKRGESIAVNGVCLTVTSFSTYTFTADVMHETLRATSLQSLQRGSRVNLEKAMGAKGRFGGHFVTGHVDGIGKIKSKKQRGNACDYKIQTNPELLKTMIVKGSVAVDGTSLTLFDIDEETFTLSLIPHTMAMSVLGEKGVNDVVNIESDMMGKYIYHFLVDQESSKKSSQMTKSFLKQNGFA
ncbi:riboflavin synthase [Pullulanibacillus pueri]|uniref:Riboflavin synthase n=1 Tax=Pullulanibacillus pueri TaxID=1437324 RepID=A0A8J2ZT80_9BACL|nr:riboflavin synthase [Pullulanibacillus pueri]MBM7680269.1 riboflavin synthase [Pullulanibacillus pueri]GGH75928.1 riboflavin synthase subunit alpha [Pullulanibacillus pueri]